MLFKLEVQQIDRSCLFRLAWEGGQQLTATLAFPPDIYELYGKWQQAYLNFYKQGVRARVAKPNNNNQGKISIPRDWHRQLVLAEASLLDTFQRWLRGEELYEIREKIKSESNSRVCITCNPLDLARLPWETWEIGNNNLIVRSPVNIRGEAAKKQLKRRRKPRILVILGDDTGISTEGDRESIDSLKDIADIKEVTWDLKEDKAEIREKIKRALIEPNGWEILFFAGHSNESKITGGELAIAPGVAISVKEIAEQLTIAKNNGLRFALFNSCSGLSIANSLIDLGLNQVAIMREPIHNKVAQLFLVEFIGALGKNCDVGEALVAANEVLQADTKYPSSYLIPSLYCHPEAEFYEIIPWKWQNKLQRWLPTRREAIALSGLCFLSLLPPVENFLLERRVLVQAIYRDLTGQITETAKPPVALIHIDNKSLTEAKIVEPVPMDRSYLASLIDAISTKKGKVIGIDYLFDLKQPNNDPILAQSVSNAVDKKGTWFVFGAIKQNTGLEIGVAPETGIGDPKWTMQGYTDGLPNYVSLLPKSADCEVNCPFAYLLTMVRSITQQPNLEDVPKPNLTNAENLRQQVYNYVRINSQSDRQLKFLDRAKLPSLTSFTQYFRQQWGRPIADFSLPPDLVYDRLPAWQLLTPENASNFQRQTVIIGSGGYATAGLTPGSDIFPTPPAVSYWQVRRGLQRDEENFTGSEFLAYMTHHLLQRRLVVPFPTIIAIAIGFLIATSIKLVSEQYEIPPKFLLIFLSGGTAFYGLLGLQLYISAGILFPWLLPAIALSAYLLPTLRMSK